jgi:hypothetical protein
MCYVLRMPITPTPTGADAEAAARAIARWLAPYLADELQTVTAAPEDEEGPSFDKRYDRASCREFVLALGDSVLDNAETFFNLLVRDGEVGSLALAEALGVDSPRNIPAILTTPLKRRANTLGLPYPWQEAVSPDNRTIWRDPTGACKRMLEAIKREQHVRAERSAR